MLMWNTLGTLRLGPQTPGISCFLGGFVYNHSNAQRGDVRDCAFNIFLLMKELENSRTNGNNRQTFVKNNAGSWRCFVTPAGGGINN